MKRILSILTLCAVLVPALVSCNNDKGGGKAKDIKFDTPKYVDDALLIKLPTGDAIECTTDVLQEMTDITLPPVKAGGSIHITGLETTEAGKVFVDAMIDKDDLIPTEDYSKFKKHKKDANGNLLFRVEGTFVGSKDKFDIKDKKGTKKVAEVVLKATKASSKMSLTFTVGGESQTVVANVTTANKPSGLLANLCMSFKVHRTVIDVDGVGGNWWDGCDLVTIAAWLKKNGVNIPDDISGYQVVDITFTANNTVEFSFKEAQPFYGTYSLSGNKFSYDLTTGQGGNSFLNAKGSGDVSLQYVKNTACLVLKINSSIATSSKTYTGSLEFDLVPVK